MCCLSVVPAAVLYVLRSRMPHPGSRWIPRSAAVLLAAGPGGVRLRVWVRAVTCRVSGYVWHGHAYACVCCPLYSLHRRFGDAVRQKVPKQTLGTRSSYGPMLSLCPGPGRAPRGGRDTAGHDGLYTQIISTHTHAHMVHGPSWPAHHPRNAIGSKRDERHPKVGAHRHRPSPTAGVARAAAFQFDLVPQHTDRRTAPCARLVARRPRSNRGDRRRTFSICR